MPVLKPYTVLLWNPLARQLRKEFRTALDKRNLERAETARRCLREKAAVSRSNSYEGYVFALLEWALRHPEDDLATIKIAGEVAGEAQGAKTARLRQGRILGVLY